MKYFFLIFIFPVFLFSQTQNENGTSPFKYKHKLGFAASTVSGIGISYQYAFAKKMKFQVTGIIFYNEDDLEIHNSNNFWGSIGGEMQYSLHETNTTRFYLYLGTSIWYRENNYGKDCLECRPTKDIERRFSIGPGFGFDFAAWDRIVFAISSGLQFNTMTDAYAYHYYNNNDVRKTHSVHFSIYGGIYYRF